MRFINQVFRRSLCDETRKIGGKSYEFVKLGFNSKYDWRVWNNTNNVKVCNPADRKFGLFTSKKNAIRYVEALAALAEAKRMER